MIGTGEGTLLEQQHPTSEQMMGLLRQAAAKRAAEQGLEEVCKAFGVSAGTYYRRRPSYTSLPVDHVKRRKRLEKENRRLKRVVADLTLDRVILQSCSRETTDSDAAAPRRGPCATAPGSPAASGLPNPGPAPRHAAGATPTTGSGSALVRELHQSSRRYPRYGYRMITALRRQEGGSVNRKRLYRRWRHEGLHGAPSEPPTAAWR